jgi:hypothetical protein
MHTLAVKFGAGYLSVAVFGPSVTDAKTSAVGLAKIVVSRLGG